VQLLLHLAHCILKLLLGRTREDILLRDVLPWLPLADHKQLAL
jgi:hypothetical protein